MKKLLSIIFLFAIVSAGVTSVVRDHKFHNIYYKHIRVGKYQKQIDTSVLVWNKRGRLTGQIFNSGRVLRRGKRVGYVTSLRKGFILVLKLNKNKKKKKDK